MLDVCDGICINPPRERLQRFRDAGPFQQHEDPPVVGAGVGAGEVGEQDARVFRVDLKGVVCHDTLGDAPLRRVNAFNRVST